MTLPLIDELESLNFNPISITDKELFDNYFLKYPPVISEYTFTNLFMWRNYYLFYWKVIEGHLCLISAKKDNELIACPPIGENPLQAIFKLKEIAESTKKTLQISKVDENLAEIIQNSDSDISAKIEEDRDNWDYIYNTSDLVSLHGKIYFNKRKKLNKFKRLYDWEYQILEKEQISRCLELQEEWCNLRHCSDNVSLENEDSGIKEILKNWNILKFQGVVLIIDGKIIAYSLGESLNPSTVVIHAEKANTEYTGAYQMINQLFAEKLAAGYEYINREQDLGEPNLRSSKMNYHPVKMGKKFIIKFLL